MKIRLNDNAASNYFNRCYRNARPDAYGLHNEDYYQKLMSVQGQWLDVDTKHLFDNQFNTTPIENVSVNGLRIMIEDVVEIENDIRDGVVKCRWCFGYDWDNDSACDTCGRSEYLENIKAVKPAVQAAQG